MNIFMSLAAPTYFIDLKLWTLLMLKMLNFSLKNGNTGVSSFAYSANGLLTGSGQGNYLVGYKFGQLALKVNEKFGEVALTSKIYFMVGAFINHWSKHVKEDFYYLRKAFESGNEMGDPSFSAYAANVILAEMYIKGEPLNQVHQELNIFLDYVEKAKNIHSIYFQKVLQQMILSLQETTTNPLNFSHQDFNEAKCLEKMQDGKLGVPLHFYYITKLQLFYLFEDYQQALSMAKKSEDMLDFSFGLLRVVEHHFYYSLTLLALYSKLTEAEKDKTWVVLKENQEKLKIWANNCPENFLHKYLLITAEISRISNHDLDAIKLYKQAITSARENEYNQNEALANELAAKFYLKKEKYTLARAYLMQAYYGYVKWGAIAKAKDLKQKYPELLMPHFPPDNHLLSLDLGTVIKASQTLSSEIVLDKLLAKFMKIVIENAGAQKGFLILDKNGNWVIEAEGVIDSDNITTLQSIPIENSSSDQIPLLSVAIINYVAHTQKDVVLNDASSEGQFTNDPYIISFQPKSILSTPLLYQGKLSGILYLENNLTTDAFTPERIEILKILSVQAAISIDNSRLYEQLEDYSKTLEIKVEKRTQELSQKNEELAKTLQTLKATQAQIIAQEKLASLGALTAGIAHEIKNPLNFVNNFAELSIELTHELLEEFAFQKDRLNSDTLAYLEEILQDLSQNAQKINEHGRRADKIVHGMLMHSRGETVVRQQTDINALLAESISLAYHGMRAKDFFFKITIETNYDRSIEQLNIIPQDINRVFLNIINNACYAAHNKQLRLQQESKNKAQEFIALVSIKTQNLDDCIKIHIRDNGNGISQDIIDRIFNPFFTTKPTGEGTGLGLSISHDIIVQEHQGTIQVETEVGSYTEFIITLPKSSKKGS